MNQAMLRFIVMFVLPQTKHRHQYFYIDNNGDPGEDNISLAEYVGLLPE